MARPWVKLHTKMLDNPDIAELPDCLYRRWIELLMLAGRNDDDGQLQPVKKMAFILHLSEANLSEALTALAAVGVVYQDDEENWHVTNWKKHQYSESVDRVRKYREKHKENDENSARYSNENTPKNGNNARVTRLLSPLISSISISDSISLFNLYESEIGVITPMMSEKLNAAWDDYPHEWFPVAFDEAVRHNARNWSYIAKILSNWKANGFQNKNGKGTGAQKETIVDRERRRLAEEATSGNAS